MPKIVLIHCEAETVYFIFAQERTCIFTSLRMGCLHKFSDPFAWIYGVKIKKMMGKKGKKFEKGEEG